MKKKSLGILVSGSGTNLQAIIDNTKNGRINAEIKIVISDNAEAYALERAEKAGIQTAVILRKDYPSKSAFETTIINLIKKNNVDLICLAGFMRILSAEFIRTFEWKIINIHPALLPNFPGLHAQRQALDQGARISGCTVHFVDEGTDTGPIILQSTVPVEPGDTEETLSKRILKEEHKIYSEAIELFCEGRLEIIGRSVVVKDK